jgi:hypothetical protein
MLIKKLKKYYFKKKITILIRLIKSYHVNFYLKPNLDQGISQIDLKQSVFLHIINYSPR